MERLSLRLKIDGAKRKPSSRREFLLKCGKAIKTKRKKRPKTVLWVAGRGRSMMRMMEKKNWILWKFLLFTLCRRGRRDAEKTMPNQTTLATEQLETQLQSWFLFMFNFSIWYMHQHQDGNFCSRFAFVPSPSGLVIDTKNISSLLQQCRDEERAVKEENVEQPIQQHA